VPDRGVSAALFERLREAPTAPSDFAALPRTARRLLRGASLTSDDHLPFKRPKRRPSLIKNPALYDPARAELRIPPHGRQRDLLNLIARERKHHSTVPLGLCRIRPGRGNSPSEGPPICPRSTTPASPP